MGIGTPSAEAQLDVRGGNWSTPAIRSQGAVHVTSVVAPTGTPGSVLRVQNEWGRGTTDLISVGFYMTSATPPGLARHDGITRITSWRRSDTAVAPHCPADAAQQDCYQTRLNFLDVGELGVHTPLEMVVGGSMSVGKTDAPGERLDVNGAIRATSAIYTTGNADYRHPTCRSGDWTCISTYVFTSHHYYGPSSNADIWLGESANQVRVRGYINNPDGELRLNDTIRTGTVHSDGQFQVHSWDGIVHSSYEGYDHDLIGTYYGWDRNAIYIAGYQRDTQRVIVGNSAALGGDGTVDLHVSGQIYGQGGQRLTCESAGAVGAHGFCVFHVGGYDKTAQAAAAACRDRGARLCTLQEVWNAQLTGGMWCSWGWTSSYTSLVADGRSTGYIAFPMQHRSGGCCNLIGVCTSNQWNSARYGANCCR